MTLRPPRMAVQSPAQWRTDQLLNGSVFQPMQKLGLLKIILSNNIYIITTPLRQLFRGDHTKMYAYILSTSSLELWWLYIYILYYIILYYIIYICMLRMISIHGKMYVFFWICWFGISFDNSRALFKMKKYLAQSTHVMQWTAPQKSMHCNFFETGASWWQI